MKSGMYQRECIVTHYMIMASIHNSRTTRPPILESEKIHLKYGNSIARTVNSKSWKLVFRGFPFISLEGMSFPSLGDFAAFQTPTLYTHVSSPHYQSMTINIYNMVPTSTLVNQNLYYRRILFLTK